MNKFVNLSLLITHALMSQPQPSQIKCTRTKKYGRYVWFDLQVYTYRITYASPSPHVRARRIERVHLWSQMLPKLSVVFIVSPLCNPAIAMNPIIYSCLLFKQCKQ
ncbi:hypothetical protein F4819DRAFT_348651 [Hypoxylon fuscum]|nr:hypothetical protein F4819DRAFT_348651 [Hypoxylon fuscum]